MKYEVLTHWKGDEFEASVNRALAKGAQLVGGVSVAITQGNGRVYAQAILKPE